MNKYIAIIKVTFVCVAMIMTCGAMSTFAAQEKVNDKNIEACFNHYKGQDFLKAIEYGKKAVNSSPKDSDSFFCLGISYCSIGEYKLSLAQFKKAETLVTTQNGIASIASWLGSIYYKTSNNDDAFRYFNRALAIRRDLKDAQGISQELNNIANILQNTGQRDKALEYYQESLKIDPDEQSMDTALSNIANIYLIDNNTVAAEEYFTKALKIAEKYGDFGSQATYTIRLGSTKFIQGDVATAKSMLEKGLIMAREIKSPFDEALALDYLGRNYYKSENIEAACDYLRQAILIYDRIGSKSNSIMVQRELAFYSKKLPQKVI